MIILYKNDALLSTITATHTNASYPLSNLKDFFLKKIWKGTQTSETITINFGSDKTVNACFIGYTNMTSCTLKLYSSTSTLLSTQTIPASSGAVNFTAVLSVRYCTLELVADTVVYVGNIGIGNAYKMPDPRAGYTSDDIDKSNFIISDDGQMISNISQPRKKIPFSFFTDNIDTYNAIKALYYDNRVPLWVDACELNHGALNPFYCRLTLDKQNKTDRLHNFTLIAEELH